MRQLTGPAHAGVEGSFARIGTITAVGFQEVMAALRQRQATLAAVKGYKPRQALVTQMPKVRLAKVDRLVSRVAEIALRDHPKRADGRQRSTVIAVQFVPMIAVDHDLAFKSARKFQPFEKHIAWVAIALIPVSTAYVFIAVTRILIVRIARRPAPELDPVHLDLTGVVIAIPRIAPSRIVIRHRRLLPASGPTGLDTNKRTVGVIALADVRERLVPRRDVGISDRGVRAWSMGGPPFAAA